MDFSIYTTSELYKMYRAIGWEIISRDWPKYLLMLFLFIVAYYIKEKIYDYIDNLKYLNKRGK